ncbi:MAG: diaminopimelate epimerase [Armatimonadetes bacterium]|nr:diaminopimelate epimerase [Armatimonadota bacterium]
MVLVSRGDHRTALGGVMIGLPFTKMQAVGNDFVVIEEAVWGATTDWTQTAIRLCDRHKGVGGDGLLVVCPSTVADVRMRMFNPDGTEDMCGNGLRCVVRFASERGYLPNGVVETLSGVRAVWITDANSEAQEIHTEMGVPLFRPAELPACVNGENVFNYDLTIDGYKPIPVSTVNTGSTHTVIWVKELPGDELFFDLSPKIEHHPLFPERTSVLWAQYSVARHLWDIRIGERGVGETLGCGTGACAVAVLAARQQKNNVVSASVPNSYHAKIKSKGGTLKVAYTYGHTAVPYESMILAGTAHTVYSGIVQPAG